MNAQRTKLHSLSNITDKIPVNIPHVTFNRINQRSRKKYAKKIPCVCEGALKRVFHNSLTPIRGSYHATFHAHTRVQQNKRLKTRAELRERALSRSHAAPCPISTGFAFQQLQCGSVPLVTEHKQYLTHVASGNRKTVSLTAPKSPDIHRCPGASVSEMGRRVYNYL